MIWHILKAKQNIKKLLYLKLPIIVTLCMLVFAVLRTDPSTWVGFFVDEGTDPLLFIFLMVFLPVFGFPINVFLVLCGVKFPLAWAVLLSAASMGFHLAATLFLANTLLKRPAAALRSVAGRQLPTLDGKKGDWYTFLFVAIPGLPYFVKNYLLAISRISKRRYFGIGWSVQFVMGLPLIGIGGSAASMSIGGAIFFFMVITLGYFGVRRLAESRVLSDDKSNDQ